LLEKRELGFIILAILVATVTAEFLYKQHLDRMREEEIRKHYKQAGLTDEQVNEFIAKYPEQNGNSTWIDFAVYWKAYPSLSNTLYEITGSTTLSIYSMSNIVPLLDNFSITESEATFFVSKYPELAKYDGLNLTDVILLKYYKRFPHLTDAVIRNVRSQDLRLNITNALTDLISQEKMDEECSIRVVSQLPGRTRGEESLSFLLAVIRKYGLKPDSAFDVFLLTPHWRWTPENESLVNLLRLVDRYPKLLNCTYDPLFELNLNTGQSSIDLRRQSSSASVEILLGLIKRFELLTIERYSTLFQAAVDVYSDFFMTTTSKPIVGSSEAIRNEYLAIEDEEVDQLAKLLQLYIDWDQRSELFIDLETFQPIVDLSICDNGTYEYAKSLMIPSVQVTTYTYSLDQLKEFVYRYGGELKIGIRDYDGKKTDFPSDLCLHLIDLNYNITRDDFIYRPLNGYTRFMYLKYWIEELRKRHEDMWQAMENTQLSHIFQRSYNLTDFDLKVFVAIDVSREIHPDESCGWITDQVLLDLKSLGLAAGYGYFNPGHISPAPWVSRVFISSQAKYGGALNYHNYIPWGSTGIERFNMKEVKSSDWKEVSISPFLYYGACYLVYKFQPGFNLTTAQRRTGIMTKLFELSVPVGNQITAISLSLDGNKLAVGTMVRGNFSTLSVYSVSASALLWAYNITDPKPEFGGYIKTICWDSDDRIAIGFEESNEVHVFSSEGELLWRTQLWQFKQWNHPIDILSMDWSPSHELAVVGHIFTCCRETEEDILVIFDSSGKELHRSRLPVGRTLYAEVRWSPNGSYLAFADCRCVALISHDGEPLWNVTQEIVVDAISWHPDAIGFATGKWNELTFYSLEGEEVFSGQVPGHVYDLVWSPDGDNLAALVDSKGQSMLMMMTREGFVSWYTDLSRDRILYNENADFVWNRAGLKLALIMNETAVVVYVVGTK
jgi:hypothetical protein